MINSRRRYIEEINRLAVDIGGDDVAERLRWPRFWPIAIPMMLFVIGYPLIYLSFPGLFTYTSSIEKWPIVLSSTLTYAAFRPSMAGRLPHFFYASYCAALFSFCILYNTAVVVYLLVKRRWVTAGCGIAQRVMMERKKWPARKAFLVLRLNVYVIISALAAYCSFALLNTAKGWLVFDANNWLVCTFVAVGFCVPGTLALALWLIVIEYVVSDFRQLIQYIKKVRG